MVMIEGTINGYLLSRSLAIHTVVIHSGEIH